MDTAKKLFKIVGRCHVESTYRDNPSTVAVKMAAHSSGKFTNSIIAALSMLGNPHGPVQEAAELLYLDSSLEVAKSYINVGLKVPGWGTSFMKGAPDPIWEKADRFIKKNYSEIYSDINEITLMLHNMGKIVYPNPACYTAITAIVNNIPPDAASYIFIKSRLPAWFDIYVNTRKSV